LERIIEAEQPLLAQRLLRLLVKALAEPDPEVKADIAVMSGLRQLDSTVSELSLFK